MNMHSIALGSNFPLNLRWTRTYTTPPNSRLWRL